MPKVIKTSNKSPIFSGGTTRNSVIKDIIIAINNTIKYETIKVPAIMRPTNKTFPIIRGKKFSFFFIMVFISSILPIEKKTKASFFAILSYTTLVMIASTKSLKTPIKHRSKRKIKLRKALVPTSISAIVPNLEPIPKINNLTKNKGKYTKRVKIARGLKFDLKKQMEFFMFLEILKDFDISNTLFIIISPFIIIDFNCNDIMNQ